MIDPRTIKKDFPTLRREVEGRPVVYLDSAASSQTPQSVIDVMTDFYENHRSNVHRGVYQLAEEATDLFERGRTRVAGFVDAPYEGVVWTRNATEAINLLAYSWVRRRLGEGDVLLTSQMEHHANLVPWQQLAAETGATLEYVRITDDGRLDLDDLRARLARGPRLVAFSQVSNALGTINPVADIAAMARESGAVTLLDAAQSVPHMPVDVAALGVDFAALSGHKMLGPSGIGALWGRRELLDAMPPFLTGGSMIRRVTLEGTEWNEAPWKFEAGTPAIAEAAGLAAAVDYLERLGMDEVRAHERVLFERAWAALGEIDGVRLLGPADRDEHAGVISFVVDGVHPHDVATILDAEGVAVRAGHHCAQPLMQRYDLPATTRASFSVFNDLDDVERLTDAIRAVQRIFGTAR